APAEGPVSAPGTPSESGGNGGGSNPGGGDRGNGGGGNPSGGNSGNSGDSSNPNAANEVQQGENVPKTELATPTNELISAVLTPEELAQLKDSDEVKVVLQIDEAVPVEDKQAVESVLEANDDLRFAQYMNITLFKVINGDRTQVTKTDEPIRITFEVPEALRGANRTFAVIRVHDGEATLLSDLDNDENTVTIETDKFSTYALVYRENASAPDNSGNPSTGIAISLVPLAAAATVLMVAANRRKR
ncbi:MAG: hypothetical protein K2N38_15055, partial [Oscillospiraceae bacterium]|nr:hypothetical protein [Oscillospiraceae bacterium]